MKSPLGALLQIKEVKAEDASRLARSKRELAEAAQLNTDTAIRKVQESFSTLTDRQDRVYAEIIGRVVTLDDLEETKSRVFEIDREHGKLIDSEIRARHIQAEAEEERDRSADQYRTSRRILQKYQVLTEAECEAAAARAEWLEEIELEDLCGRRPRSAE